MIVREERNQTFPASKYDIKQPDATNMINLSYLELFC